MRLGLMSEAVHSNRGFVSPLNRSSVNQRMIVQDMAQTRQKPPHRQSSKTVRKGSDADHRKGGRILRAAQLACAHRKVCLKPLGIELVCDVSTRCRIVLQ